MSTVTDANHAGIASACERIMADAALHRARAELVQVRFEADRWRARFVAMAAVAGLSLAVCTAQLASAERNNSDSGQGNGEPGGPVGGFDHRENWSPVERFVDKYFGPDKPVPEYSRSEPDHSGEGSYGGNQAERAGF